MLETLLIAAAGLAGVPYLLGPLLVWRGVRADATLRLEPTEEAPPPAVEEAWRRFAADVERCGLRRFERWRTEDGQRALVEVFTEPGGRRAAYAYAVLDARGRVGTQYSEVSCRLAGGGLLSVSSAKLGAAFAPLPGARSFVLPDVEDGGLLCRLHEVALERFVDGRPAVPVPDEHLRESAERISEEVLRHQVTVGLQRRGADGRLRPTAKGALFMTWRQLFPWKQLAARRRRREAAELLAFVHEAR